MRRATIIRLAVLGWILPAIASAQPFLRHNWGTVADLPAVSASSPGRIFTVTDGADESDCETGGGSESVMCRDTGIAWVAVGSGGDAGTVTSVSLTAPSILSVSGSPVTTTGTLTLSLATQAANSLLAGPTTGADAAPTFRALVSADVPNNAADTTGNAATATALASNGANCSAGQAAAGVDASGAAEGCAAYLADITGETIGDLSDVDETGASTGEALVSDGAGSWAPSAAAVCLSNGTNCPSGSAAFSAITTGTNTAAAMVIGSGASLKVASTGTIDASGIDADGDSTRELLYSAALGGFQIDGNDDATPDIYLYRVSTGGGRALINFNNAGSFVWGTGNTINLSGGTQRFATNPGDSAHVWSNGSNFAFASGVRLSWSAGSPDSVASDAYVRRSGTSALTIDSNGAGGAADLTVTGDVSVGDDLNITSAGGLARLGAASGALPTCEAATARAVIFDQTGDLCACPPDGSEWYDVSDGLGTAGDCA